MAKHRLILSEEFESTLNKGAALQGVNAAEFIRRAILYYYWFIRELMLNPKVKVALVDENGNILKCVEYPPEK